MMRTWGLIALALVVLAVVLVVIWPGAEEPGEPGDPGAGAGSGGSSDQLVLYAGRSRSLVQPLIQQFERETGVRVRVRYGETAQLAATLREEGDRSPADVFWAQDAGALGSLVRAERFTTLPAELVEAVPGVYRNPDNYWVGTSGRARVLAYSPERVSETELPASVFDLTDEQYAGRVAWAPTNGSFQAFVTAMRTVHGDDRTRQWLTDMHANGTLAYSNNTAVVQAIAAGEADLGLVNHYYLLRFKSDDPNYPVEQTGFENGDIGNLVLTSGAGVLTSAGHTGPAERFVAFLLSEQAQQYFVSETFEYPVTVDVSVPEEIALDPASQHERAPGVELDTLDDLEGTLRLFREVGLL